MSAFKDKDPRIHGIQTQIRVVPNFPKEGFTPSLRSLFFRLFIIIDEERFISIFYFDFDFVFCFVFFFLIYH